MNTVYLDNNATTRIDPVVAERMHELHLQGVYNPASQHRAGRHALHLLERAKVEIAESVGASFGGSDGVQVLLTSGGTEANNLAISGLLARRRGIVIVAATEHPSVLEAARHFAPPGHLRVLPVDGDGICDLDLLEHWLQETDRSPGESVTLVSIMLGNNETGVIQDLKSICDLCHRFGIPIHCDVVQAAGKIPLDMQSIGLSALTLTAHKIHGPIGIGALILQSGLLPVPLMYGGGQQLGLRPGTEPVVPAVAFAAALTQSRIAAENGAYCRVEQLRDQFEQRLVQEADVYVVGQRAPRLPHTSNVSFLRVDRQALHMALDLKGLACSTGSACSSGSATPSGSLVAMGLPQDIVRGALRFSFSRFSSQLDVDLATGIILDALQ
jgi:cysteine desulfurase